MNYTIFDVCLSSDIPLPTLSPCEACTAEITIRKYEGSEESERWERFHTWHEPSGRESIHLARNLNEIGFRYQLCFPNVAIFYIQGKRVEWVAADGCEQRNLQHVIIDQLVPRMYAHAGHLVLHSAGLVLKNGRALLILGNSGQGKSTLAAALMSQGATLLGDDCVELRQTERGVELIPSYSSLRLADDSWAHLQLEGENWKSVAEYAVKQSCPRAEDRPTCESILEEIYLLGNGECGSQITIEELSGAVMVTDFIKHSFVLDPTDTHCAGKQLRLIGSVMQANVPLIRLDYPRDFTRLGEVCYTLQEGRTL